MAPLLLLLLTASMSLTPSHASHLSSPFPRRSLVAAKTGAEAKSTKAHAKHKKHAPAKPQALPVQWSCRRMAVYGTTQPPLMDYDCQMTSNFTKPVCVKLKCQSIMIGACPKGGTGAGTNDVTPAPCSWGLIQPQGANACVPKDPIYPHSMAAFGFTVDSTQHILLKTNGYFSPIGQDCSQWSPDQDNQ